MTLELTIVVDAGRVPVEQRGQARTSRDDGDDDGPRTRTELSLHPLWCGDAPDLDPVVHEDLDAALALVARKLRRWLTKADALAIASVARAAGCPPVQVEAVDVEAGGRRLAGAVPLVRLPTGDQDGDTGARWAFAHAPGLTFRTTADEPPGARVHRLLHGWLRKGGKEPDLDRLLLRRHTWLHTLELEWPVSVPRAPDRGLAALFGGGAVDGAEELEQVGRNLEQETEGAAAGHPLIGRAAELDELTRLLAQRDRRPLLLVGEPGTGKSALLRAWLERHRAGLPAHATAWQRRRTWHLAPQRLISGMMYVGQWQRRLKAILDHARTHDLVLVFDDLAGLVSQGRTRNNDLCLADVLAGHAGVRLVAEATPALWAWFQDRHRLLAERFQVLPLAPASPAACLPVLLALARRLDRQQRTAIAARDLRRVLELHRHHGAGRALPGAAVDLLESWAAARCAEPLAAHAARRLGLARRMVEPQGGAARWTAGNLAAWLDRRVLGQPAATAAVAAVLAPVLAGLADPSRPRAVLLLSGPSGTGKTELAKAVAGLLTGDPRALVRFDLGEYGDPGAVERLAGDAWHGDGELTAALRRRPHGVFLFDEVEKGDPGVHDLLLHLLGEGRLSDGFGRPADGRGAVFILTSNLGAQAAAQRITLGTGDATATWHQALTEFFRPEFLGRMDAVLPFARLDAATRRLLAARQALEVARRDGLLRRRLALAITPAAAAALAAEAEADDLGARALRRMVDRRIGAPLAALLAGGGGDGPALVRIAPGTAPGAPVRLLLLPLAPVPAVEPPGRDGLRDVLTALADGLPALRVSDLAGSGAVQRPGRAHEALHRLRAALAHAPAEPPAPPGHGRLLQARVREGDPLRKYWRATRGRWFDAYRAVEDVRDFLRRGGTAEPTADSDAALHGLLRLARWLHDPAAEPRLADADHALVLRRGPAAALADPWFATLDRALAAPWPDGGECHVAPLALADSPEDPVQALLVSGPGAALLAGLDAGWHLRHDDDRLDAVQVVVVPLRTVDSLRDATTSDSATTIAGHLLAALAADDGAAELAAAVAAGADAAALAEWLPPADAMIDDQPLRLPQPGVLRRVATAQTTVEPGDGTSVDLDGLTPATCWTLLLTRLGVAAGSATEATP